MVEKEKKERRKFRPEIEGLRAVAAILVAVYHIWFGTVSGGVDVFFVVSGFLITTSLLSRLRKHNKINFLDFLLKLSKRLFPSAFFVMLVATIASIFWLPHLRWDQTVNEVIASAFYYQNWQLALNAVDYLAQNNEASPFQHIWAMSIQGQFYVIWPIIFFISLLISKKLFRISLKKSLLGAFSILFLISFAYSIYKTSVNQPWAYYDTFARIWEFSIGGLLALSISYISFKKSVSFIVGWLGLFIVVSTGALLPVSNVFPGYAALLPTLGAVGVVAAGADGGKFGVHRLLSAKPFLLFGSMSYAFYLWHWPILIFYYINTGYESVSILHGLFLIVLSGLLAYITTRFIEKPLREIKFDSSRQLLKQGSFSFAIMLPLLIVAGSWWYVINEQQTNLEFSFQDEEYVGAMALHEEVSYPQEAPVTPMPVQARNDKAKVYDDGCHQSQESSEVIECRYGVEGDATYTVALVGGSHSAHWLDALEIIAEQENLEILSYTKSACRFSAQTGDDDLSDSCYEWSDNLLEILLDNEPDIVFTTADVGSSPENESVPEGFIKMWDKLNERDIDVFAIRDNPWMGFDVPACVEENEEVPLEECSRPTADLLPEESAWEKLESPPENVYYADLSDYFCEEDVCNPIIGNVLVYRDSHHITGTFSKSLAPVLQVELMKALED
jgi:peptidoglycan/LPS O-acetylase OafA/YrhL